jgi:hypothetical protein
MRVFGARSAVFSGFLIILCATRALVPHYTADVPPLPLCSAIFPRFLLHFLCRPTSHIFPIISAANSSAIFFLS